NDRKSLRITLLNPKWAQGHPHQYQTGDIPLEASRHAQPPHLRLGLANDNKSRQYSQATILYCTAGLKLTYRRKTISRTIRRPTHPPGMEVGAAAHNFRAYPPAHLTRFLLTRTS